MAGDSNLVVDGLGLEPDGVQEEVVALDGGHTLRVRLVALPDLAELLFDERERVGIFGFLEEFWLSFVIYRD